MTKIERAQQALARLQTSANKNYQALIEAQEHYALALREGRLDAAIEAHERVQSRTQDLRVALYDMAHSPDVRDALPDTARRWIDDLK